MAKVLRKQLEEKGITPQEVITYTDLFGKGAAMNYFGVRNIIAFNRYLRDVAGTDEIGLKPKMPTELSEDGEPDYRPLVYRLAGQLKQRIFNLLEQNERQRQRIKFLEEQLQLYKLEDYKQFASAFRPLYELTSAPSQGLPLLGTPQVTYDVMGEAEGIVSSYAAIDDSKKPEYLLDGDWQELSLEVRSLYCRCEELAEQLPGQFHEAVNSEEWQRALFICIAHQSKPWLPHKHLDSGTFERRWDEGELVGFTVQAREWIAGNTSLFATQKPKDKR
jgi:hypothetical protein